MELLTGTESGTSYGVILTATAVGFILTALTTALTTWMGERRAERKRQVERREAAEAELRLVLAEVKMAALEQLWRCEEGSGGYESGYPALPPISSRMLVLMASALDARLGDETRSSLTKLVTTCRNLGERWGPEYDTQDAAARNAKSVAKAVDDVAVSFFGA
jgi:hypothetical protein